MKGWATCALVVTLAACASGAADAAELRTEIRLATANGPGDAIGTVSIADSPAGAVFKTALKGLPPGPRGFHVHENGSCSPTTPSGGGAPAPAGAAGGHFDPQKTGKHEGPQGAGHAGDLPVLTVAADGTANESLTAPHIKDVTALRGKAVVIHAGGDNYSDQPTPFGGGGGRIACGVLQ